METSPTMTLELVIMGIFSILFDISKSLQLWSMELRSQVMELNESET